MEQWQPFLLSKMVAKSISLMLLFLTQHHQSDSSDSTLSSERSYKRCTRCRFMWNWMIANQGICYGYIREAMFAKVILSVKVIKVREETRLLEQVKQDVVVADHTGLAKVTLWADNIRSLQERVSYLLKDFVVGVFQSFKCFSLAARHRKSTSSTTSDMWWWLMWMTMKYM